MPAPVDRLPRMSSTGPIVGSFQIARAYGVTPRASVPQTPPTQSPAQQTTAEAKPASRLVAGTVPGRISFAGDRPASDTSALAMYRHPADKNAAATAVSAGKLLDLNG
jgi:hypothetical protein